MAFSRSITDHSFLSSSRLAGLLLFDQRFFITLEEGPVNQGGDHGIQHLYQTGEDGTAGGDKTAEKDRYRKGGLKDHRRQDPGGKQDIVDGHNHRRSQYKGNKQDRVQ